VREGQSFKYVKFRGEKTSGRGAKACGNLAPVVVEGEFLPAFALEYRLPRAPIFLEAENDDPLSTFAS
jgi:hypothetical protein